MNTKLIGLASGVLGLAVGAVAGYFVARKVLEQQYSDLASQEIAEAKAYLNTLYKDNVVPLPKRVQRVPEKVSDEVIQGPPTNVLERIAVGLRNDQGQAVDIIKKQRYGPPGVVVRDPDEEEVQVNVFDQEEDEKKHDNRKKLPAPEIIREQDFMSGDVRYAQVRLTYYAGDDTLCDEGDLILPNSDYLVGDENLGKFGYMTEDPNALYVRNHRMMIDYEISRSPGTYKFEVLGEE